MTDYPDKLRVQLRAHAYTSRTKVLQWRVDPNDDLSYSGAFNFLGIIPLPFIRVTRYYQSEWRTFKKFSYTLIYDQLEFDDPYNWEPIWCNTEDQLDKYKQIFRTVSDVRKFKMNDFNTAFTKWYDAHDKYLKKIKTIY